MVSKLVLGGILILMLSAGFVFMSWDPLEEDSKIINDDEYKWSEPKNSDGSVIVWEESEEPPMRNVIDKEEYNKIFSDYREGLISQGEASYVLETIEPQIICYGGLC